jgi:hypothetical protein
MNPFDVVKDITFNKAGVIDETNESEYIPFIVNKALGSFNDTIFIANEMNMLHTLDKKLQYDFYFNVVRKKKRFSKWFKKEENADLDAIRKYYGYNVQRAKETLKLLTKQQLEFIKNELEINR